ncbi:MAG: LamG-like jellyroll fold domain-containing protein, partial [Candidatus Micrarchaeia archaeon]
VVGPIVAGTDCTGQHIFLTVSFGWSPSHVGIWGGCDDWAPSINPQIKPGNWYFLAYTYNTSSKVITLYDDGGSNSASTTMSFNTIAMNQFDIGNAGNGNIGQTEFYGYIANVQYYNTTLSANEIQALYLEGIGGAPIDLQNLVGWWPLNGNANDYSGNGNNGVPSGVTYTSNWWQGYTPP